MTDRTNGRSFDPWVVAGVAMGRSCPVECEWCGERLDTEDANIRWNGEDWEHRSENVHPQVGYHRVRHDQR